MGLDEEHIRRANMLSPLEARGVVRKPLCGLLKGLSHIRCANMLSPLEVRCVVRKPRSGLLGARGRHRTGTAAMATRF